MLEIVGPPRRHGLVAIGWSDVGPAAVNRLAGRLGRLEQAAKLNQQVRPFTVFDDVVEMPERERADKNLDGRAVHQFGLRLLAAKKNAEGVGFHTPHLSIFALDSAMGAGGAGGGGEPLPLKLSGFNTNMLNPDDTRPEAALRTQLGGLEWLYKHVKEAENEQGCQQLSMATDFGSSEEDALLLCMFNWYATSFVTFIGLYQKVYAPPELLPEEFAPVFKWRHKVAAHTSWEKPRNDSNSVQEASVAQYITWSNGRASVGREICGFHEGDSTPRDWGWELTVTHEKMREILKHHSYLK